MEIWSDEKINTHFLPNIDFSYMMNDDAEETAFHEWCAYNIAHCSSLIDLQKKCQISAFQEPITHSSHPALLPKKDYNGNKR